MDGQKDEATRKYEREIRLGMSLLGVLALLFVGVLARRVWMENSQLSASTKKPIYLSRVERDQLRAKAKPLPLFSVNASSRPMQAMSTQSAPRAAEQANLEQEAETIPDLEIEDVAQDKPDSQPASFLERDKPSPDESPDLAEPSENTSAKKSASPITPTTKPAADQTKEADPATESANTNEDPPGVSRFSGSRNEIAEQASEPEASDLRSAPADDPTSEPIEPPKSEETKNIRKKSDRNPWKRAASDPVVKPAGPRHTVVKGDTLKSIAKEVFDNESRWREIYDLNREQIGDDFSYLKVGIQLQLPPLSEEPPIEGEPAASAKQVRDPK